MMLARKQFLDMFMADAMELHKETNEDNAWFIDTKDPKDNDTGEWRSRRVLALLFCAHLVEIGAWG